jgi:tetratricopeptide (TPR) repeat protein
MTVSYSLPFENDLMSGPSESDRIQPGQSESFEERIDMLLEELSFALQRRRPSILLAFYESEPVRDRAERALGKRLAEIGQPLVQFPVDEKHFDIPRLLSERPDREGSVYSVTGLSQGGGKEGANAYRALNIRREYFVDYAIRVILWLNGDEAMALSRHAPDFWAFRHRVVEFYDSAEPEQAGMAAAAWAGGGQGFSGQPEEIDEQIGLNEAILTALPVQAGSITRRLDLLLRLAGLYHAKKAYDQAIQRLKQGLELARQMDDRAMSAPFWGKLGLVYLDLDQPYRAVRACRKAVRLDPKEAGLWNNLGHLYHVEKRFSDAIIAYREAIRLDPQDSLANSSLVACYRLTGKTELAEKQKKLAQAFMQNGNEYQRAVFESVCGNSGKALELLEIALGKKQVGEDGVRRDPNFDFIRDEPRFAQLAGLSAPEFKGK